MKAFLKELFEYNHSCNQKLGNLFNISAGKTSEKAIKLYSHILNAHQIWNNRIEPQHPAFGIWKIHAIPNCQDIDKTNYEHTLLIIDKLDLNSTIQYSNSKRRIFSKSIGSVLFHVINHSTYHRGQIATEFRRNGLEPLSTDYIFYEKE